MGFQCQFKKNNICITLRNVFSFVMFCSMMLQSSWFIVNKRLIADHYTLQEMSFISFYQQAYFFASTIETML
jgi:hypothetical protein